jgi:hypothetical protein
MPIASAQAQVHVNIGINLPAPPPVVVVPEVRTVQYVTSAPYNLFVYNGQYWAFSNNAWYVAAGYNGPWIAVGPQFVPRPLLLVPVRYYPVPPGHWKQWERQRPPHWHDEWGREWAEKREWRADKHHGDDGDGDRGRGRGHGRDR